MFIAFGNETEEAGGENSREVNVIFGKARSCEFLDEESGVDFRGSEEANGLHVSGVFEGSAWVVVVVVTVVSCSRQSRSIIIAIITIIRSSGIQTRDEVDFLGEDCRLRRCAGYDLCGEGIE